MVKRTSTTSSNTTRKSGAKTLSSAVASALPLLGARQQPAAPGRTGKSTGKSTADNAALNPAARRRAGQRRKERMTRRVRKLEAVLPSGISGAWRPGLPQVGQWPLWRFLRRRWVLVLGLLLVGISAVAIWVHSDERWFLYREDARFSGLTFLTEDELWPLSEIDGWNMFWLDTNDARRRLLANPYVADADVYITPLQGGVNLVITEAQPVALWVTDVGTRWLLPDGTAVEPRGATPPGLLEIIDGGAMATAPGSPLSAAIDPDVLASAQSLLKVLPGVAPLRYNRQIGLNFQLQDKPYWVYWGDGAHVARKLDNLAAAVQLLEDGTLSGTVIDVRFERPYVK